MIFKVEITHNGVTRSFEEEFDNVELVSFMFGDGNYACDCNRALFFARAAGEDDPDRSCSDHLYTVKVLLGEEVIYEDA